MPPRSPDPLPGSREGVEDECRQARGLRLADECRHDLRYAVRHLNGQPGFSLAATLTLALGLGLAVGLFAVVDAVLLQPLPFADQDELVVLWEKDDSTDNPTSRSRCRTSRTGGRRPGRSRTWPRWGRRPGERSRSSGTRRSG